MSLPAPRYDIELSVHLASDAEADAFDGVSWNLSETGALLHTARAKPRGTRIRLRFPSFSGTAEVVWVKELSDEPGSLLGMEFVSLSPADRNALEELLSLARPSRTRLVVSTMDPAGTSS